jgi:hypothetical protein
MLINNFLVNNQHQRSWSLIWIQNPAQTSPLSIELRSGHLPSFSSCWSRAAPISNCTFTFDILSLSRLSCQITSALVVSSHILNLHAITPTMLSARIHTYTFHGPPFLISYPLHLLHLSHWPKNTHSHHPNILSNSPLWYQLVYSVHLLLEGSSPYYKKCCPTPGGMPTQCLLCVVTVVSAANAQSRNIFGMEVGSPHALHAGKNCGTSGFSRDVHI